MSEARAAVVRWLPVAAGLVLLTWVVVAVNESGGDAELVAAALLPAALALRIGWIGYRTAREGDREEARTVVAWVAGGGVVMCLVVGWFVLLVEGLGVTPTPTMAGLTVVGAGALLGLRIGRASARAKREAREVTRERLARRYAQKRQERISLLNRILRHNVRNALNVILGYADLLTRHVDEEGADHLAEIREHGAAVGETVNTFQRVAETLAGTRDVETRDVAEDLRRAVRRAREQYPVAEFETEIPDEATVVGNDLLERMLYAQLENAVEHNDGDPRVVVTCERTPSRVVARIADNGPGIPDAEKDLIFEAGDRGVTTEGDGLELFLAAAVVERYGGRLSVEDNHPRGAVFVTELPRSTTDRPRVADHHLDSDPEPSVDPAAGDGGRSWRGTRQ